MEEVVLNKVDTINKLKKFQYDENYDYYILYMKRTNSDTQRFHEVSYKNGEFSFILYEEEIVDGGTDDWMYDVTKKTDKIKYEFKVKEDKIIQLQII